MPRWDQDALRERDAAVRELWLLRWSDAAIADRVGCSDRTVRRVRRRLELAGWPTLMQMRQLRRRHASEG